MKVFHCNATTNSEYAHPNNTFHSPLGNGDQRSLHTWILAHGCKSKTDVRARRTERSKKAGARQGEMEGEKMEGKKIKNLPTDNGGQIALKLSRRQCISCHSESNPPTF